MADQEIVRHCHAEALDFRLVDALLQEAVDHVEEAYRGVEDVILLKRLDIEASSPCSNSHH
jgi:hypothetical protein